MSGEISNRQGNTLKGDDVRDRFVVVRVKVEKVRKGSEERKKITGMVPEEKRDTGNISEKIKWDTGSVTGCRRSSGLSGMSSAATGINLIFNYI